ncbi:MAG: polysaccharide deacetylase family protein [Candidatus Omnitrophica bacterium]|nr:polysaccharide deacetylase family protein [Candidatus Omnitrophota bacterium]
MKNPLRSKRRMKKMIQIFSEGTGLQAVARRFVHPRYPLRILLYHSISDTWEDDLSVPVEAFREQMAYLADHYHVIPLEEACRRLEEGDPFSEKTVVMTFDDGYRDNFDRAYPILEKFRLPATIFLLIGGIGTEKRWPPDAGEPHGPLDHELLSWEEVQQMQRGGLVTFGSHTMSHALFSDLSPQQAREEISTSKRLLEEKLGKGLYAFTYPFGTALEATDSVKHLVRESGFYCACTAMIGGNGKGSDLFALRRTPIEWSDGMDLFKKKLEGALDLLAFKDSRFGQTLKGWVGPFFGIRTFRQRREKLLQQEKGK